MLYLCVVAIVVILAIAYRKELSRALRLFAGKVSRFVGDAWFPFIMMIFVIGGLISLIGYAVWKYNVPLEKEMTVTVIEQEKHPGGCHDDLYLKLSDGYCRKIHMNGDDAEWMAVKKGDKIRKLYYADGNIKYTPVFDDNVYK